MRPDVHSATERVVAIRVQVTGLATGDVSRQEIEDALCAGYAEALAGDAWLAKAERRLHELMDDPSGTVSGRELRTLAGERTEFERGLLALRDDLAALRRMHDRLRTRSQARSV